jgi:hypothetical protein
MKPTCAIFLDICYQGGSELNADVRKPYSIAARQPIGNESYATILNQSIRRATNVLTRPWMEILRNEQLPAFTSLSDTI